MLTFSWYLLYDFKTVIGSTEFIEHLQRPQKLNNSKTSYHICLVEGKDKVFSCNFHMRAREKASQGLDLRLSLKQSHICATLLTALTDSHSLLCSVSSTIAALDEQSQLLIIMVWLSSSNNKVSDVVTVSLSKCFCVYRY